MSKANTEKLPSWLELHADKVVISLSIPSMINGVQVEKLTMRTPKLQDVDAAEAQADPGSRASDKILFASLMDAGVSDLSALTVKDYNRVNKGYFRLVEEDDF
jgi:hypothetical protein